MPIDLTSLSPQELELATQALARKKRLFDAGRAIERSRELIEASRALIERHKKRAIKPPTP